MEHNQHLLSVLEAAARPWHCPEFEGLRETQSTVARTWNPEEIHSLCERICAGNSLDELALAFERSPEDILSIVRDFGSWLSAVEGPGESVLASEEEQPQLFALPTEGSPIAHVHPSLRPLPRKNEGSLRAITWHRPSVEVIKTFRLRQDNSGADKELLDSTVAAIATFARQGRLGDVTLVNPRDETFQKVICDGYDVLEVYRQDAIRGIASLAGLKECLGGLPSAVRMARPLFPSEARMMDAALQSGSEIQIRKATGFIFDRLATGIDKYALNGPHALSVAQVVGICIEHGLLREHDSSAVAQARALLTEHGLSNEVSFLLRTATRAVEENKVPEFLCSIGVDV